MKQKHIAYKITQDKFDLVCTYSEFEEDKMLDLLHDIQQSTATGLYWIFKQVDNEEKEALCIIDCDHNRIYYHYSGEVEDISRTVEKLSQ